MTIRPFTNSKGAQGWQIDVSQTRNGKTRRIREVWYRPRKWVENRHRELDMELEEEVRLGRRRPQELSFFDLVKVYLAYSETTKKTYKDDVWRAKKLKTFFGDVPAFSIRLENVAAYQVARRAQTTDTGRQIAAATVNRETALLSAIYTFGIRTGRLTPPHNPCSYLKSLPEASVIEREITDEDLLKLCAGREHHVRLLFLLARFTGLRCSALLGLDWSQITADWIIYPTQEQAKSRKRVGRVPIREGLRPALGDRKTSGRIITYHGEPIVRPSASIRAAAIDAGIKFRLHDLRASFHNELLRAGVDEIYRKILMGHGKDLAFASTVQERYARVLDADLTRIINSLPSCQQLVAEILEMPVNRSNKHKLESS